MSAEGDAYAHFQWSVNELVLCSSLGPGKTLVELAVLIAAAKYICRVLDGLNPVAVAHAHDGKGRDNGEAL